MSTPVMIATVEPPPGHPGTPPHRHAGPMPGGMLDGEMLTLVPAGDLEQRRGWRGARR